MASSTSETLQNIKIHKVPSFDIWEDQYGQTDGIGADDIVVIPPSEIQSRININGILKGSGNGNISFAVAGTDYATPNQIPSPANTNPIVDGTASAGSAATWSRSDHVHPTDTSRAPTNHSTTTWQDAMTYGIGTNNQWGHLKLSDAVNSMSDSSLGAIAATPYAVKRVYDLTNTKEDALPVGSVLTVLKNQIIDSNKWKSGGTKFSDSERSTYPELFSLLPYQTVPYISNTWVSNAMTSNTANNISFVYVNNMYLGIHRGVVSNTYTWYLDKYEEDGSVTNLFSKVVSSGSVKWKGPFYFNGFWFLFESSGSYNGNFSVLKTASISNWNNATVTTLNSESARADLNDIPACIVNNKLMLFYLLNSRNTPKIAYTSDGTTWTTAAVTVDNSSNTDNYDLINAINITTDGTTILIGGGQVTSSVPYKTRILYASNISGNSINFTSNVLDAPTSGIDMSASFKQGWYINNTWVIATNAAYYADSSQTSYYPGVYIRTSNDISASSWDNFSSCSYFDSLAETIINNQLTIIITHHDYQDTSYTINVRDFLTKTDIGSNSMTMSDTKYTIHNFGPKIIFMDSNYNIKETQGGIVLPTESPNNTTDFRSYIKVK